MEGTQGWGEVAEDTAASAHPRSNCEHQVTQEETLANMYGLGRLRELGLTARHSPQPGSTRVSRAGTSSVSAAHYQSICKETTESQGDLEITLNWEPQLGERTLGE